MLRCSFGIAPSQLAVLPVNRVNTSNQPAATIMDHQPMVNIAPFGMCMSLANPAVAAAPWVPGATTVLLGNQPALDNTCTLNCIWGGVIQVAMPGQFTENIP
jgi:Domain of unknown function (DUF4280)